MAGAGFFMNEDVDLANREWTRLRIAYGAAGTNPFLNPVKCRLIPFVSIRVYSWLFRSACARRCAAFIGSMFGVTTSDDYRPVTWIGRYPVRITSIIAALYVLGMFATVIAMSARWDVTPLAFQSRSFLHGWIWQPFTCIFIQPASFFFLFNVIFFYWAGTEVEKYLGIRRYLLLFGMLLLVAPVVLIAWGQRGAAWNYLGSYEISIGVFIAFATLYPNVELFGWVSLKWLAFAGLVLASMQYLPNHEWGNLSVLWTMCLAAFLYIRFVQGRVPINVDLQKLNPFRRQPRFHIVQKSSARRVAEPEDVYESVDPILDKIAKSGIGSLTASERKTLDRARNRLLKKSE
jgi:membrane associated rhomboid family serine protease